MVVWSFTLGTLRIGYYTVCFLTYFDIYLKYFTEFETTKPFQNYSQLTLIHLQLCIQLVEKHKKTT